MIGYRIYLKIDKQVEEEHDYPRDDWIRVDKSHDGEVRFGWCESGDRYIDYIVSGTDHRGYKTIMKFTPNPELSTAALERMRFLYKQYTLTEMTELPVFGFYEEWWA